MGGDMGEDRRREGGEGENMNKKRTRWGVGRNTDEEEGEEEW